MKKSGLKNEELLRSLQTSGSAAITSRNLFGVHLFTEENLKDGVVGAKIGRPAYNLDELRRSVDTDITELVPVEAAELPDTVLREDYDEVVAELSSSVIEIQSLEEQLQSTESLLLLSASRVQELTEINDGLELQKSLSDNRLETANDQISSITTDLQYAIQKSTQEAINRVSLERRNGTLIAENERYRELLYGRQARLDAGGISSGTIFTVNALDINDTLEPPIYLTQEFKRTVWGTNWRMPKWVNGQRIEVRNSLDQPVSINVTLNSPIDKWFRPVPILNLEPEQITTIRLQFVSNVDSDLGFSGRTTRRYEGSVRFSSQFGGNSEEVTLQATVRRERL